MKKLIIVGTGSTARRIYDFVKQYNLYEVVGFVVDKEYKKEDKFCNLPVYSFEELEKIYKKEEIELFIAVLWNNLNKDRKNLFIKLKKYGYKLANLISPTSIIRGKILGENCWVQDYVILDTNSILKTGVILSSQTFVLHDSIIEDFVFTGSKVTIGGKCIIGAQTFIGLNALVFDQVHIKEKCIIGAGTVIKRNIEKNTVCKLETSNINIKTYSDNIIETKLIASKNVR